MSKSTGLKQRDDEGQAHVWDWGVMLTEVGRKAAAQLCSASVVSSGETIFIPKPRVHMIKRWLSPVFMEMKKASRWKEWL